MKNQINKRIKLLRTEAEISQITMAEKLDMTINQYSRLEKMGKSPAILLKNLRITKYKHFKNYIQ